MKRCFLLLGGSGQGKSLFTNQQTNSTFAVGGGTGSTTKKAQLSEEYIDSQGLNDTDAPTANHTIILRTLAACADFPTLSGILIFQKPSDAKWYVDQTIGVLVSLFGPGIKAKIGVVFTKCASLDDDDRERLQENCKAYDNYIEWDSKKVTPKMTQDLEAMKKKLAQVALQGDLKAFFDKLDSDSKQMREEDKETHAKKTTVTESKNFVRGDYWKWTESSSGSVWGSIFSFGITSMVKEDSSDSHMVHTNIPPNAKVTWQSLNMVVESADCWDESHNIQLQRDNTVLLTSTLRYAKQRGGYAWIRYRYDINILYDVQVDGVVEEKRYKHELEHYRKIIIDKLLEKYFGSKT